MPTKKTEFTKFHVGVAAEAIAAGMFARCGFDVSVQYGANQPEYDLLVSKGELIVKISVKGSSDGAWGLMQSYLPKRSKEERTKNPADYQTAIQKWRTGHGNQTFFCLVQFLGVAIGELPRIYLASPAEIARHMSTVRAGQGGAVLYERREWTRSKVAAGTTDEIPETWVFSEKRLKELMPKTGKHGGQTR